MYIIVYTRGHYPMPYKLSPHPSIPFLMIFLCIKFLGQLMQQYSMK